MWCKTNWTTFKTKVYYKFVKQNKWREKQQENFPDKCSEFLWRVSPMFIQQSEQYVFAAFSEGSESDYPERGI